MVSSNSTLERLLELCDEAENAPVVTLHVGAVGAEIKNRVWP
jgi:hypothetical protein